MKSLINIGGASALFLVSVAYAEELVKAVPPQQKVLSSENGRFVFGQISEYRRDQYMLDTKTGRLWQKGIIKVGKEGEESEMDVFQAIPYKGIDGKWSVDPK